jgi:hypothetical protein
MPVDRRPGRRSPARNVAWLKAIASARRPGARGGAQPDEESADPCGRLGFRPRPAYTAQSDISPAPEGAFVLRDRAATRSFSSPRRPRGGGPRARPAW